MFRVSQSGGVKTKQTLEALSFSSSSEDPLADAFSSFWYFPHFSKNRRRLMISTPGVWLQQQAFTAAAGKTSPGNFENLGGAVGIWTRDLFELGFICMKMALYHPTDPSAAPALDFFRSCANVRVSDLSHFAEILLGSRQSYMARALYWPAVKAAQMLERRSAGSDARFILDFVHSKIPYMFTRGHRPNSPMFEQDTDQRDGTKARLPRPITDAERRFGLKSDSQGIVQNRRDCFGNSRGV